MHTSKRVTRVALSVVALVVALLVLASNIRGSLSIAGHRPVVIVSGSMEPAVKRGDLIILGPARHIAIGDIITFKPASGSIASITHRVVGIRHLREGIAYETKGDANRVADADLVQTSNVIGVSTLRIPAVGYFTLLVRNRSILAALIIAFLLTELTVWMPSYRYAETTHHKQKEQL